MKSVAILGVGSPEAACSSDEGCLGLQIHLRRRFVLRVGREISVPRAGIREVSPDGYRDHSSWEKRAATARIKGRGLTLQ